jgi:polysaccharide biosynthesis protein PslG
MRRYRRLAIGGGLALVVAIGASVAVLFGGSGSPSSSSTAPAGAAALRAPPWGFTGSWRDYCYRSRSAPPGYTARVVPPNQPCPAGSRHFGTAQQIALTARAGATIDRLAVHWGAVEPAPPRSIGGSRVHTFNWAPIARIYDAMLAAGIRPVALAYGAPKWARRKGWNRPGVCEASHGKVCAYPPSRRRLSDWRAFIEAMMRRFPQLVALEVWNEPNLPRFFAPRPSPALYSQLVRTAHQAAVDSGSATPILTAGLSVGASDVPGGIGAPSFLTGVYRMAGEASFDGIGAHPYPHGPPRAANMTTALNRVRRVRDRFGDTSTPLWITEVGVGGTSGRRGKLSVALPAQGPVLANMYRSTQNSDIRSFIIYALRDTPVEGPKFEPFGVVRANLQTKPAYCYLARRLGGVSLCGG